MNDAKRNKDADADAHATGPLTPYLTAPDADAAIQFYTAVFGGGVRDVLRGADGKIVHAAVLLPGCSLFVSEIGRDDAGGAGAATVSLHLYVDDADTVMARALAHGAHVVSPVADQFYGDRRGTFAAPDGHIWHVAHRVEQLSEGEMQARFAALLAHGGG